MGSLIRQQQKMMLRFILVVGEGFFFYLFIYIYLLKLFSMKIKMNMLRADRKISANKTQKKTQLVVGCHRNNQQQIKKLIVLS